MTDEENTLMFVREFTLDFLDQGVESLACPIVAFLDIFAFARGEEDGLPCFCVDFREIRFESGCMSWARMES